MKAQRIRDEGTGERPHVGRRRFLGGVGAGGLATAAAVFGFASPALASSSVKSGCCTLCCPDSPTHNLTQCTTGFHYVWTCTESTGKTCHCCEHEHPCVSHLCNSVHYSVSVCM